MAWYEIAVEGDAGAWERLLAEQEAGTGQRAVRGQEVPLRAEPPGEPLLGPVGFRARHLAFVPGELARGLVAALASHIPPTPPAAIASIGPAAPPTGAAASHPGLCLARVREVTGGHFDFSVEAFSEPAAKQIRAVLGAPAPGVEVHLTRDEEERDPEAGKPGAVELYAPAHCYAYRAWGTVSGPFQGVQELHRQLHQLPFVYEERLELAAQPVDPADLAPGAGSLKGQFVPAVIAGVAAAVMAAAVAGVAAVAGAAEAARADEAERADGAAQADRRAAWTVWRAEPPA